MTLGEHRPKSRSGHGAHAVASPSLPPHQQEVLDGNSQPQSSGTRCRGARVRADASLQQNPRYGSFGLSGPSVHNERRHGPSRNVLLERRAGWLSRTPPDSRSQNTDGPRTDTRLASGAQRLDSLVHFSVNVRATWRNTPRMAIGLGNRGLGTTSSSRPALWRTGLARA